MALSPLELSTMRLCFNLSTQFIGLKGMLDELNVILNQSGGVASTITQGNLDLQSFSGLTVQQAKDMFAALSTIQGQLTTSLNALSIGAARAGN